ncbi:MAG: PQQ-binding-like beta-propeller repeat protein [Alphaproteobacteria bacterium]
MKDKTPLPGKRQDVFTNPVQLQVASTMDVNLQLHDAVVNQEWSQAGFNASHAIPHLKLGEELRPMWTTAVGQGSSDDQRLLANLVVHGGHVYTMDAGAQLSCLDSKTGQVLWTKSTVGHDISWEPMGGGLAFEDGRLFATTSSGETSAYDTSGNELWRQNVHAPVRSAPSVKDGRLFVVTVNNEVHALDAKSGTHVWTHAGIPEVAGLLGGGSPAIKDNIVVVAYSSGEVYALDADRGDALWSDTLVSSARVDSISAISHIRARPIIADGKVYAISHGGRMAAIDLKTGARLWQQDIGGMRTPALMGGYIFLVNNHDELLCLHGATGKVAWTVQLPKLTERVTWAGPVLAGGNLILCGSNGEILFMSPQTGAKVKSLLADAPIFLSPVVAEGALFVLTDKGSVISWR